MDEEERRVALATGGAHGIGRAVAARLARDGWRVVVADRDEPTPDLPARFVRADVSDEEAVAGLITGVREQEGRLDGLVCNAGFMIRKPLRDLSLAEWQAVLGTNLTSTFLLVRAAESLLRARRGVIVTIASTRAHQSEPDTESYSASKGGLLALTHALALSLGPDVRAKCISPGWIDTKGEALCPEDHAQHLAGRVGLPEDVVALVAWLLGPESGFVTGAEFIVDGGMTQDDLRRVAGPSVPVSCRPLRTRRGAPARERIAVGRFQGRTTWGLADGRHRHPARRVPAL